MDACQGGQAEDRRGDDSHHPLYCVGPGQGHDPGFEPRLIRGWQRSAAINGLLASGDQHPSRPTVPVAAVLLLGLDIRSTASVIALSALARLVLVDHRHQALRKCPHSRLWSETSRLRYDIYRNAIFIQLRIRRCIRHSHHVNAVCLACNHDI